MDACQFSRKEEPKIWALVLVVAGALPVGGSVSRMVNLTALAPDIVAAILDDTLPNHITLFDLAVDPPALWDEQRARVTRSSLA